MTTPKSIRVEKARAELARFGESVELRAANLSPTDTTGTWNVLCYEVDLKGREVAITKTHLQEIVSNFEKYPKVPIVIEHADTDWMGRHPSEYSEAHGWVSEVRIKKNFKRSNGATVWALEGRLAFDETTKAEVNADPPKWPFGSVTLFFDQRSEESDEYLGAVLHSFSLTTHPALIDVPRLEASARIATEKQTMKTLLMLATMISGVANNVTEEAAFDAVRSVIDETADIRKALKLGKDASSQDVIAKVAELSVLSIKNAELSKKNEELSARIQADEAAKRKAHIDALCASSPGLADARDALSVYAESNYAAFSAKYPLPAEKPAQPAAPAVEQAHTKSLESVLTASREQAKAPTGLTAPALSPESIKAHAFINRMAAGLTPSLSAELAEEGL